MAQRINQFFGLLQVVIKQLFDLMGLVVNHAPVLHHFIVEVLLLALLVAGARELFHALP
jgi:hypothetical protein